MTMGSDHGRQTVVRKGEAAKFSREADPIALTFEVGGFPV